MKPLLRIAAALLLFCLVPMAHAKRAPNLEFKDLKGNRQKVADLRGSIVVLNFWATWCGPCQDELPMLSALTRAYAGKKIRFIAASANEEKERSKVDAFLAHHDLAMEVWLGADLDMLDRAQLGNVLPATLILDDQGEVVARIMGQAREQDVKGPIEWLLGGKSGPPPQVVTKRY
jgi:thiol-disulfide isomerase/thioredoxin